MNLIKTQGIVLSEFKTGEADKIITIFTKKQGIIRAVVKGAYRPKSTLIACSSFLAFSDFILYKGNDLYRISSAEVIEPFYDIRNDIEKFTYASYCAEIVFEVMQEKIPGIRVLQLLLNTLFAISYSEKSLELIIRSFEMKLMVLIGYKPRIDNCLHCGSDKNCNYFSFSNNGLICEQCSNQEVGGISISESTAMTLRYIIKSDIKKLFSFNSSDTVLKELKLINSIYIKDKIDKDFVSLKILDKI